MSLVRTWKPLPKSWWGHQNTGNLSTDLSGIKSFGGYKAGPPATSSGPHTTTRRGGKETAAIDWVFAADRTPDPVFVARRVTRHLARIESFDGEPYSDPMPVPEALKLVKEISRK